MKGFRCRVEGLGFSVKGLGFTVSQRASSDDSPHKK